MSFKDVVATHEYRVELAKLDFALEVHAWMQREGVNSAQLADLLGVSRPMVSKLLKGDANVTVETMVKVAEALGGALFLKIVRKGCTARVLEIAEAVKERARVSVADAVRNIKLGPVNEHQYWVAANELSDEAEPLAA